MNRSHIIEILALFRLQRLERLDYLLPQCQPREIAEAIARMNDGEQLDFLRRLDPDQRHQTLMALDYPAWTRLVDAAGPMVNAWTQQSRSTASPNAARMH